MWIVRKGTEKDTRELIRFVDKAEDSSADYFIFDTQSSADVFTSINRRMLRCALFEQDIHSYIIVNTNKHEEENPIAGYLATACDRSLRLASETLMIMVVPKNFTGLCCINEGHPETSILPTKIRTSVSKRMNGLEQYCGLKFEAVQTLQEYACYVYSFFNGGDRND